MTREPTPSALRDLRSLLDSGAASGLSDEQLLRRYVDRRAGGGGIEAEAAFARLVDRHGPMVWGVCRRALVRVHEAEDAFQATFLVLARRADAVRVEGSLGRWLHGVALRVATRSRADGLRRRAREGSASTGEPAVPPPDPERVELLASLDEELGRLPEKYRSPMVLCHLEGLSYAEAADRLGCPPGAVKGRLARGRDLLRARLTRRGLTLAHDGPITADPRPAVPLLLARSIARVAASAAPSATVAGVSASAFSLAKGVLRAMSLMRLTKILALLAPTTALVGLWIESPQNPAPPPQANGPPPIVVLEGRKPDRAAIVVPLPSKDDLRVLLRRLAGEAVAITLKEPRPAFRTLTTIAQAQAQGGDLDGARETFAIAAREAIGDYGGTIVPWNVWRVGHFQAEAGLRDEARATLRRASECVPRVVRDFGNDSQSLNTLAVVVQEQVKAEDQEEARRTVNRLKSFAAELFTRSETGNSGDIVAAEIAGALAAVDDFEGAFQRASTRSHPDMVAAQAALAAARALDRGRARRYVDEAVARMAKIETAEAKYMGLSDLAEAQAIIGDTEGAKASARSIGEGPIRVDYDMTDGQAYAMIRVATVQRNAGQADAARETLREAYRTIIDHPKMRGPEGRLLQVAQAQVVAGDLIGALRTAESMPEGHRAETLAQIARSQALTDRGEQALKTAERALADARVVGMTPAKPDPTTRILEKSKPVPFSAATTAKIAQIQAMVGDIEGALKTLEGLDDAKFRRAALNPVAEALAASGDVKGAFDLATREGKTSDEKRVALEAVAKGVEARLLMEPR